MMMIIIIIYRPTLFEGQTVFIIIILRNTIQASQNAKKNIESVEYLKN